MRQATAFKEYFLQLLRLLRQGTVSFVLFESLCSLYLVHCVPWSFCFFGPPVCCEEVLLCIVQQWTVFTVFLRYSAWPVQWFSSVWGVHCFSSVCFFSSSVFWCNVSVYCVFTGVVCFVNVFTFDLLPLTCSVVSYCLLEMIYSIQYFVCILSNGHPVCAVYVCVRVCVIVCARWSQQKVFQISQNLCGTFVVHVGGK